MAAPAAESNDHDFLAALVAELAAVRGIRAVVLGGSRATGTADARSDYDVGLYYAPEAGVDIADLRAAAARLEGNERRDAVTAIGEWGPWINGGGWLTVGGRRVDLLYRDLDKVATVVEECQSGTVSVHYQPGHPHVFVSAIYCGEIAACRVLHEKDGGAITALKRRTAPYPPALAAAIVQRFLWEADFAIANADKSAKRGDLTYVAGCAFRAVACLCQVLFAVNGRYLLNEKGAVARIETLPRHPVDFGGRIDDALRRMATGDPTDALARLRAIVSETVALATG